MHGSITTSCSHALQMNGTQCRFNTCLLNTVYLIAFYACVPNEKVCAFKFLLNGAQCLLGSAGTLCSVCLSADCIPVESCDDALSSTVYTVSVQA